MWLFRSRAPRAQEVASPAAGNHRTQLGVRRPAAPVDFRAHHAAHYAALRAAALAFDQPGFLLAAVDVANGALAAVRPLAARPGALATAIVGRHSQADLVLSLDPRVALRHLVIAVEPPRSFHAGDQRLRVIDLATGNAPLDEEGRAVESLTAEGAVFLALGRYAIYCLPTGDATDWPAAAADAWRCVPERVFLEERLAGGAIGSAPRPDLAAQAAVRKRRLSWLGGKTTLVSRHEGPVDARAVLLSEGEEALGVLTIRGSRAQVAFEIGREAARRGILVGRYDRCHGNTRTAVTSDRVSRVHLLVVAIGERVYGIDLCTTNGTYVLHPDHLEPIRAVALDDGKVLAVANDRTRAWWSAG